MIDLCALLRRECQIPPETTDFDVRKELVEYWTITPDGFVKDTMDGDGNDTESIEVLL